ncbi:nuclease-related domain-containing protein [Pseudoalteromonas sp. T1lg48]|uniref:nuclease-related domain-containing protein n=1 Tax=Pseudoalteromonas sp. T1lg48 TaxID=2077100 RepID=UPI000CF706AF|nr:nuclease-related domain-containing protein [Pseudoalteromonas sp. T1lg48]
MKWTLLFSSLLLSPGLLANAQYTESECILLQHQINDFSHAQQSSPYLVAKKAYDRHCVSPRATNTEISTPTEITIRPKIANPVKARNSSSPPQQVTHESVNAFELMLSFLLPMGLWFGFALLLLAAFKAVLVFKAGSIGEWWVNLKLKELTKGTNLTLYENLLLRTENGEFTEVDHLLVSPFGIFVIESKNYSGWIFGNERQAKWTQRTLRYKSQFMNPLRQNYKHCLAVQSFLGVKEGIESLVVFNDKATFKTDMPKNVVMLSNMNDYINGFTEPKFSKAQLAEFNVLLSMREESTTAEDYKAHIQQVKARHESAS